MDLLEEVSDKVVGGVVSHRLPVAARPRGSMINNLFTASTHGFAITNTATAYAKRAEDYSICFQSILLLSLYKTTRHCHVTTTMTSSLAAEFTCPGCTVVVNTEHFSIPSSHVYTGIRGPSFVSELHVVNRNLLQSGGPQDPRLTFSIYQAFHWAQFVKFYDRGLSILPGEDSSTDAFPTFLNILDFERCSVRNFFTYLLWFIVLFDRGEITAAWNTINRYSHLGQLAGPLKTLDLVLLAAGLMPKIKTEFDLLKVPGSTQVFSTRILKKLAQNYPQTVEHCSLVPRNMSHKMLELAENVITNARKIKRGKVTLVKLPDEIDVIGALKLLPPAPTENSPINEYHQPRIDPGCSTARTKTASDQINLMFEIGMEDINGQELLFQDIALDRI